MPGPEPAPAPLPADSWIDSSRHSRSLAKTTIYIPDDELSDAMRFTRAKIKREAVVMAVTDFNRRRRMMDLVKHAGTCTDLMTVEELQAQRRQE